MSKRSYQGVFFFLSIILLTTSVFANTDSVWQEVNDSALKQRPMERQITPNVYKTFGLNRAALDDILNKAPMEFTGAARMDSVILTLPMPDGTFASFRIENSPIMEPGLAEKFPEIQTFRGQGITDPTATVRFDVTPAGFHAMVLSTHGTIYIDPYAKGDTANYISYHKTSLDRNGEEHICLVGKQENPLLSKVTEFRFLGDEPNVDSVINGANLRTYRLALAATREYTTVFGGTVAGAMAAMTTSMNRVNGVYERNVAVRMIMIANNNLIIYTAEPDPYTNEDGFAMLGQNQANIDAVIGTANYDIGHVFSTGGGGVAFLNSPCNAANKARGVTGLGNPTGDAFDIDFVAHEMGHQFGGNHTFNTSCGGNREASAAYEPGSGVTIMGYAGVCGAQDLALNSIDTFHVRSLEEIVGFINTGGAACAATTATGNTPPTITITGGTTFNIPKQTPFTLAATATDPNGDTVTFDWQQYNLGPATSAIPNTDSDGTARPILRPYLPTTGARTFPQLTYILNNANVPPSTYGPFTLLTGELLPAITRAMTFQVIARDNRANGGGINTATATVNVDGASGPMAITSPNTNITWQSGSQTVTWNVANTTNAPVSAANVKISMSTDGGNTFPTVLSASTPNDGSQIITIPVGNTTTARIKVEAVGNIFFDISNTNFIVNGIQAPPKSRADYDGDGKTDLSVFRPSEGNWYLNRSTDGFQVLNWGVSGDTLVPGRYDLADAKTDLAIFRPTNTPGVADFYILNSNGLVPSYVEWGNVGDIPVVGDYDGDQISDIAVYRPSTGVWYIRKSTGGNIITPFGGAGDVPVVGDFDGDGKIDIVIYRASTTQWLGNLSAGGALNVVFGAAGDKLVVADYDNDNIDNFAVYRPGTGTWHIIIGGVTVVKSWGISTDIPVPGDYDGDGTDDVAVYRNGTWYVDRSMSGSLTQGFGISTDIATPKAYIP